ncbi:MAG: nucleoside triphosphate pyrophosphohydrolase, partial [Clostridia bacterium]|nr:nucleoside triphosphate pyrophosphohydrolase [Clostridia bacterium]
MKEIREKSINKYVSEEKFGFEDLVAIMSLLRSEEGCPWDREQNHASIRQNLIEECYEAVEAIDRKDDVLLCEEIGDVLMQVVFHAEIA